jgi:phosphatidylserine/phosphatidylglycerophosphate/cardiolipin synthase-like enzyme
LKKLVLLFGVCLSASMVSAAEPIPATGSVEVAFTPWDDAEGGVLRAIKESRKTIYVQAYLLTSKAVARALIDARQRGVAVEVLTDREMLKTGDNSQIPQLAAAGIPVRLEVRYAAAHNKIMLIDPEAPTGAVVTGSYNFTWAAQARNAENLLILRGNPGVAAAYLHNWQRHYADALPYPEGMSTP